MLPPRERWREWRGVGIGSGDVERLRGFGRWRVRRLVARRRLGCIIMVVVSLLASCLLFCCEISADLDLA